MSVNRIPDDIIWRALSGAQRDQSVGTTVMRRYSPGFSPIAAFADASSPDLAALVPFADPSEHIYVADWTGPAKGWSIVSETTMLRMVWRGPANVEDEADDATPLSAQHAQAALELAELTRPGPFAIRTIELGDYFGYFDGDRLIAMAGERFFSWPFREISGVCTHPSAQGRGLAKRLMSKLLHLELERGEIPFLHVVTSNTVARTLYERMGFEVQVEMPIRVVRRTPS